MEQRKKSGLPGWGTILAWIAGISTVIGFISLLLFDVPAIWNRLTGNEAKALSEESIIATLSALSQSKERAELQLTQFAVEGQSAANQTAAANVQATLNAVQAQQDAFVGTQNALSGMTATVDADNAIATQAALDAGATAAAIANVTPTPTEFPTSTPVPPAVTDYRAVTSADVQFAGGGNIEFTIRANETIPDVPPGGLAYVWLLDTDRDPTTGLSIQDIGVDARVSVSIEGNTWIGSVRSVNSDGTTGEAFYFADIKVNGPNVSATVDPAQVGLPFSFDWVSRSESDIEAYPFLPGFGHVTFGG